MKLIHIGMRVRFAVIGGCIGMFFLYAMLYTSGDRIQPIQDSMDELPVATIATRPSEAAAATLGKSPLTVTVEQNLSEEQDYLNLAENDVRIFAQIQKHKILIPPSSEKYNLDDSKRDPSQGQSTVVKQIFNGMKNGFFVECGALDGETRSNTLSLEKDFGWEGLLIEADPRNFKILLGKNRKAWAANVCLATKPYPHKVLFEHFNFGKIYSEGTAEIVDESSKSGRRLVRIKCFPLFSLLAALKVSTVDYFSLDIEGHEFKVLQNIPFDKILIKVLSIEYIFQGRDGSKILSELMKSKGYNLITTVTSSQGLANDLIFAHNSVIINETIGPILT